jgi:hypothetical protein
MSVDITIRVPDDLGRQLEQYRDRLPELLERGLRDVQVEDIADVHAATDIIAALTSQPTPEQVLALRPSDAMQARVSELLRRSKAEGLTRAEETELDRYLYLEHLVRLAKARALGQISPGG